MPVSIPYSIHALPWREQLRDTYRVLFFPVALAVFAIATRYFHWPWVVVIGAGAGMIPSYRLGTSSRMAIAPGDADLIDRWLAVRLHARDARGWAPKLPRIAYFDSQIVHYQGDAVIGPLITLRKLRKALRNEASVG